MLVAVHRLEKCLLFDIPLYLCNIQWNSVMVSLVTYWACHVLYPALVSNNSFKHSPCCVNYLRLSQWTKGKKKKRIFTVWLSKTHLVEDCLLAAVCGRFSQMKSLSAVSPYSRPTPESLWIVWTQSRYEFVTSRHFIWGCRQSFLTKRRGGCKLRSARFSFLQPFSKN